jgi:hypothetical protein
MNRLICALSITTLAAASVASANPPTPPAHPENDYLAMGHGIYLMRDQDPETGDDGNITVRVYSRHEINVGKHYSLDMSTLMGVPNDLAYDGGKFGVLHMQWVKMDCAHRTYAVIDTRKLLAPDIWRPSSALPALEPVFQHVCSQTARQ